MMTDSNAHHLGLGIRDLELGVGHVIVAKAEQRRQLLAVAIVPAIGDFGQIEIQ